MARCIMATLVVETGSGLSTSNSYLSVADADTYHTNHGNPTAWSALTTTAKEEHLILASQYVDVKYAWRGQRASENQAMAWPRLDVEDNDGYVRSSSTIPREIKDAVAEAALISVSDTLLPSVADPGITEKSIKAGPVTKSVKYAGGASGLKKYPLVDKLLNTLRVGSGLSGRLYRA